jgi:VanZ family protein
VKRLLEPETARIIAWVCTGVILVLSLLPGSERPHTGAPGRVEHFIAYCGTGLFFGLAYRSSGERLSIWAMLAAISGLMEIAQKFIPARSPSVFDAIASTGGVTVGLLLGALITAALA